MATPGESLPEGYARSSTGFLICNTILEVQVDQEAVRKETERLQKYAVVAYFVGGRQPSAILNQWIAVMQGEIGEWVGLGRDLGQGFFQVLTRQGVATQKLLMRTPHRSRWGTCILQTWATGFNASHPTQLKVPTWITLRGIPGEYLGVAKEIAGGLGELLGCDRRNASSADQRFCVALQSGLGWTTQLSVTNESTKEKIVISVDYCNLPIRCRLCHSTDHLICECPSQRRGTNDAEIGEGDSAAPGAESGDGENATGEAGAEPGTIPLPPPPRH